MTSLACVTTAHFYIISSGGSSPQHLGRHDPMANRNVVMRAYNGGLGTQPPVKSKGGAPGQGVKGAKPLKIKHFWFLTF